MKKTESQNKYDNENNLAYSVTNTVVIYNLDSKNAEIIRQVCKNQKILIFEADCISDLVAVPSFLIVCDPTSIERSILKEYYDFIYSMGEKDYQVLFTKESKLNVPLKIGKNFIKPPVKMDANYFKFEIMKRKSAVTRGIQQDRKFDVKIFRLMYTIRELKLKKTVYKKDLCNEFSVTSRTIERDMELLNRLGELIEYDKIEKGYKLLCGIL